MRQFPVPNGPRCDSRPAIGVFCSADGAARYRLRMAGAHEVGVETAEASRPAGSSSWVVTVDLDDRGTAVFARLTRRLAGTGTPLALVVDGAVVTAPAIESVIRSGLVQVSGDFDEPAARRLARGLG